MNTTKRRQSIKPKALHLDLFVSKDSLLENKTPTVSIDIQGEFIFNLFIILKYIEDFSPRLFAEVFLPSSPLSVHQLSFFISLCMCHHHILCYN